MSLSPLPGRMLALGSALLSGLALAGSAEAAPQPLRFVLIPKLSHPWFDAVRSGAEEAAALLPL
jgi:ribose transport system substrate-binding protein